MTVNKFGNYLNITTQQHRLEVPPVVQLAKEHLFKSICIATLKGKIQKASLYYILENNKTEYKFKMEGEIKNIDISTDSVFISINKENPISPQKLVGTSINKDDTIHIIRDPAKPRAQDVFIEMIMLCPLIQDE